MEKYEGFLVLDSKQLHQLADVLFPTHNGECRLTEKTETGFVYEMDGFGEREVKSGDRLLVQRWGVDLPYENGLWVEWHPDSMPDHMDRNPHPAYLLEGFARKGGKMS